jgi:hypothetical protein
MSDGFNPAAGQGQQQGQQGQQSGQGQQGATQQGQSGQGQESQFVPMSAFTALSEKLDSVIADNVRYRQERRQGRNSNNGGNNNQQNGNSGGAGGSDSGNDGNDVSEQLTRMQSQLRMANFRNDITAAATRAGAIIPAELYRLIDIDDTDADDLGYVKNADKAVADLRKKTPALFGSTVQGGGNGGDGNNQPTRPANFNDELRRDFRQRRGLPV